MNEPPLETARGERRGRDFEFFADAGAERGPLLRQLRDLNNHLLAESKRVWQTSEDLRAVLNSLADLEDRYRAISDLIPFGVWVASRGGNPTFVSSSLLDVLGLTLDDLLREGMGRRVSDAERERLATAWREAIRAGSFWDYEFRVRAKDRRYRWILSRGVPLRDQTGRITCWIGINLDITARKRVEAQRNRLLEEVQRRASELDATVESLAEALVICDPSGAIVRLNAAAERILGLGPSDRSLSLAQRIDRLRIEASDGSQVSVEDLPVSRALHGEVVRDAVLIIHPRDRPVWIRVSASPIRTARGKVLGAAVTFTDVTAQHELDRYREDYLHAVSHDLRMPLSVIQGHAQLISRLLEIKGATGPEVASAEAIDAACRRMNRMIQSLIEAGRLEAGQMKPRLVPVDLVQLALDLRESLRGTHDGSRLIVDSGLPVPAVLADPDHVERILLNLVTNAFAYSPPGSPVTIAFAARQDHVVTAVIDRGQGISVDDAPRLFDRYYRTGRSAGHRQGLGLGLYIARQLVEAQGGRIWVESEPGVGSTFSFSLPRA